VFWGDWKTGWLAGYLAGLFVYLLDALISVFSYSFFFVGGEFSSFCEKRKKNRGPAISIKEFFKIEKKDLNSPDFEFVYKPIARFVLYALVSSHSIYLEGF
jgi:hypothetical protein